MSEERKVERAKRKGLVAVVERLLGDPPKHVYDYGMQPEWKKRAYQWVADQKRPEAIYPIHCWSAGYGGTQSPLTWFRCTGCGETTLGSPHKLPDRSCLMCLFKRQASSWEVADETKAFASTLKAADGMPSHSMSRVFRGP